ncbi:MAG: hypothetical protein ACRDYX_07340 [Egibacteraceae bacterium]
MIGVIERRLAENNSHATQVSRFGYVELGGLGSRVNHSCDPNCGVRLNSSAAYDLIVRRAVEPSSWGTRLLSTMRCATSRSNTSPAAACAGQKYVEAR